VIIIVLNSILLGILLFFSAVVSPTIFKVLDQRNAALIVRATFPKLFASGLFISLLSAIACGLLMNILGVALSVVNLVLFAINWLYFVPTINNTRDDTELDELTKNKKFKWLHLGSVIFYVLSMFLSISLIVLLWI